MLRTSLLSLTACLLVGCSEQAPNEESTGGNGNLAVADADTQQGVAETAALMEITCTSPVSADDSFESLRERFGEDAQRGTIYGPEGMETPGVILWGDDPTRRIEVMFEDESLRAALNAVVNDESGWTIGGARPGDTLSQVNTVNGRAFTLFGFEWDYGGMVMDWQGGALDQLEGCNAFASFAPAAETDLPLELLGDVELSSDDARLPGDGIHVWEIGIAFPFDE